MGTRRRAAAELEDFKVDLDVEIDRDGFSMHCGGRELV
jgi:hypothetical protein